MKTGFLITMTGAELQKVGILGARIPQRCPIYY